VIKFRDASRRLGHPVVIEQKFMPGDTDFRHQLRVIQDSRADAIVLWTDIAPAAAILKQLRELGMTQQVFGSHRTIGAELIDLAGAAAEGFEALYPYDPSREDASWRDFNRRFEARFDEKPDHFASLAYDAMQILLKAICRGGLNRGRIRDVLTATETYRGVTGEMRFDPNCKNINPMFLATVRNGRIDYRRITMDKPYAKIGEGGISYTGPTLADEKTNDLRIAVFGPQAEQAVGAVEIKNLARQLIPGGARFALIGISSESSWGKASNQLIQAVYQDRVLGIIALDRASSHLAEQIGTKAFVPVIALSSDRVLTSTNIPWIFRMPANTRLEDAIRCLAAAVVSAGPNRERIRALLGSGVPVAGVRFSPSGEMQHLIDSEN
jgi:branched-chain amino acid transport system substrate-binding protein